MFYSIDEMSAKELVKSTNSITTLKGKRRQIKTETGTTPVITRKDPFVGLKTIEFGGRQDSERSEGSYNLYARFLNVDLVFIEDEEEDDVPSGKYVRWRIKEKSGAKGYKGGYVYIPFDLTDSDVQINCTCMDFLHTFQYYNAYERYSSTGKKGSSSRGLVRHSSYTGVKKPYTPTSPNSRHYPNFTPPPSRNVNEFSGFCKHIYAFFKQIERQEGFKIL